MVWKNHGEKLICDSNLSRTHFIKSDGSTWICILRRRLISYILKMIIRWYEKLMLNVCPLELVVVLINAKSHIDKVSSFEGVK